MKRLLLLVLAGMLACGCAVRTPAQPTLLQTGTPQTLTEPVTLLPVRDSRQFPDLKAAPDLKAGTPVLLPASEILAQGESVWQRQGFIGRVVPYQGPMPEDADFRWTGFPLRGLDTDLAFGLEIKKMRIQEAGSNALLMVHSLADSLILPFFAVGVISTNGHLDIGARVIPSSRYDSTFEVELNVFSLKGGGRVLSKAYAVEIKDPAVSDREVYSGLLRSPSDGQRYGVKAAPKLIGQAFTEMSRDPLLTLLPRFADAVWLERLMADGRIDAGRKTGPLKAMASSAEVPEYAYKDIASMTMDNLPVNPSGSSGDSGTAPAGPSAAAEDLRPYAVNPAWKAEAGARARLFESIFYTTLREAGAYEKIRMARPASAAEAELGQTAYAFLALWAAQPSANGLLREASGNTSFDLQTRKAAWLTIARSLETLDNEEFVENQLEKLASDLNLGGMTARDAAAFLVAAKGEQAVETWPIPRDTLFTILSGDDQWAASLVVDAISSGDLGPEKLRLAGAMQLRETLPYLLNALAAETNQDRFPVKAGSRPKIPLLAAPRQETAPVKADPALIVQTLGLFPRVPEAERSLREIVGRWRNGDDRVSEALAAEAVIALGKTGGQATAGGMYDLWAKAARDGRFPLVRRAALQVLEQPAGEAFRPRVLETASLLADDPGKNRDSLREAVDFFGQVRYEPALGLLRAVVEKSDGLPVLRQSAVNALGRMATPEAEAVLRTLAMQTERGRAMQAAEALENLVKEKALLDRLDKV